MKLHIKEIGTERTSLYGEHRVLEPSAPDPDTHTMGRENFLKYIGRHDARPCEIRSKKFTEVQQATMIQAFQEQLPIHVVGAFRDDLQIVAGVLNRTIVEGSVTHHLRIGKDFNDRRSSSCFVTVRDGTQTSKELWIITFPSRQYVDQVGQLVRAILDDLAVTNHRATGQVFVHHFKQLEDTVTRWTGFEDAIKSHIRHGDVVAIGNIDFFRRGVTDAGFRPATSGYINFGIGEMFGLQVLVNEESLNRLVVIGVRECFWGEASAHYVRALIDAGARHILYGSKAASLVKAATVHETIAPQSFLIVATESEDNTVVFSGAHQVELGKAADMFAIHQGGWAVTVPTVIGEDHAQREAYEYWQPACLDCENGHIAQVVDEYNEALKGISAELGSSVKFVPVHFITDYVFRDDEPPGAAKGHLAVSANDPDYKRRRDRSFRNIGRFFALYALRHGQREHLPTMKSLTIISSREASLEEAVAQIRPLLDFGYGREAIGVLLAMYGSGRRPPSLFLALAMVGQKYGYSQTFLQAYSALKNDTSLTHGRTHHLRCELFMIKHLTQVGNYTAALEAANNINSPGDEVLLREIDQLCALERRRAVSLAAKGDRQAFEAAMERSRDEARTKVEQGEKYQDAINTLWRYIGLLHLGSKAGTWNLESAAAELSAVRSKLGAMDSKVWWQTNIEKGALSALFLESSVWMLHGDRRQRQAGLERLYLANLLNVRIGGHEHSEAYGEVLNGVEDRDVKEVLALAMRTDPEAQRRFQKVISSNNLRPILQGALRLLNSSPLTRETELQTLLRDGSS